MTYQKAISAIMDACNWNGSGQYTSDELTEAKRIVCEATEKQIPKKPKTLNYGLLIEYGWKYECPNCGCAVGDNKNLDFAYGEYLNPYDDYCCGCGQALDWSDYNA
jgi:hypothetical protein